MKNQADKHQLDKQFPIGSWVFIKLQPYRQTSLRSTQHKLSKRYFGPFQIVEKIGPVAYRLLLPQEAQIHTVFHISVLKHCPHPHSITPSPLPIEFTIPHDHEDMADLQEGSNDTVMNHSTVRPKRNTTMPAWYRT